ncbi:hypothetical protein LAG90_05125 [Marinilongibacter aquaticus]|uniref:bestrophin family protein n=1 Tax=Marinilongibacter aquaticus TaxID=2975157 RepID=UPI0021BDA221|nr:bestrophin family ion channel [Marinilongibacter aquaticus]UBM60026.1 hypothetical protein LAG90_05125 [Marinilongibacter aquaticus]
MIIKSRIPPLYLLKELKIPLIYVSLIALLSGILPSHLGSLLSDIPISIATTLGVAISILLSYKINQSYERWWEARKIWGEIVNDSRTLTLQLQLYLGKENSEIQTISSRHMAWCYCLGQSLRKMDSTEVLKRKLITKDFESVKNYKNKPLALLSLQHSSLGKLYQFGDLDKFSQIQLEDTLKRLTASMGKCERIKNTVFPPIYKLGLHASIYLFVIFLSLSVAFKLQHFLVEFFILIIVSLLFFFLEKAAFRMQDPFENVPTDIPVTSLARNIESDIMELLGKKLEPFPTEPVNKYYIL